MTKQEFLSKLKSALAGLPQDEIDGRIDFYAEMIDDMVDEGLSEEDAVKKIGSVDTIAAQILADIPLSKLAKQRIKPKRRLGAWEIVLIALGSPIWLSLIIAAFAVVLSVYVSLWAIIVSLWAVFAAIVGSALGGLITGVYFTALGNTYAGLGLIAAALILSGISIFAFFGCRAATKGIIILTKKFALAIKKAFVKKEAAE